MEFLSNMAVVVMTLLHFVHFHTVTTCLSCLCTDQRNPNGEWSGMVGSVHRQVNNNARLNLILDVVRKTMNTLEFIFP